jgi:hypothetical protein
MKINCSGRGCLASIELLGSVSPTIRYHCKDHVVKAKNDIRFQDYQFDHEIGSGTDPKAYERGVRFGRSGRSFANQNSSRNGRKRVIKKAEESLVGHENKIEILNILKLDTRN